MPDFTVRSDSVNVEQIMEQIRARIRDKRGVDYTEEQIRELAAVKLQKFLDPRGVRSDLLEQFRKTQPPYTPPELPNYAFEDNTLFDSHRGGLRFIRRLLNPILKLFFNPNPLIQALHIQSRVNSMLAEREARLEASRRSTESLYYELIHNLVVETTRLGIEVKNLTMRVESLTSRLEFSERRARSLESVVVYREQDQGSRGSQGSRGAQGSEGSRGSQGAEGSRAFVSHGFGAGANQTNPANAANPTNQPNSANSANQGVVEGPGQRSRRRRRRRGRRGGVPAAALMSAPSGAPQTSDSSGEAPAAATETKVETHSPAAESVEQALASESHPSEPGGASAATRSDVDPEG